MDYQSNEQYERSPQPRRVLRQTTLPSNLPNPDQCYSNNTNLMPPVSPKQQLSPQYSPYNTDNEDSVDCSNSDLRQMRYPMRRQSTLPSRPNEQHVQKYFSTSPNRNYSRSPEKADTDQPKYPPFVRQSTFPSNSSSCSTEQYMNRPKILLPISPNRSYSKLPDGNKSELPLSTTEFNKRHTMLRQSTLPNPEQHMKLLPTSPPKRQTSPNYIKRSPEMLRQNTLPNPDGMNSLSIHQHSSKFLPISPRHKQNFLFPQPANQNPRQFLSQQNVPTVTDDPYSSTGSMTSSTSPREHHSKMIKVRSHSNEEYSITRSIAEGGRRLLPEIPRNRSPRYYIIFYLFLFANIN